ncbi:sensor histidine kinase [Nannocystis sp. SCPEA4]|uniref:sensor histidine kinase n=1 Tax=Nannocystis sp. SCPEA4 TaxID=2996787 RepID=UPI002270C9CC|nr:sensor histidine kinase [Nannocystis sp. SCPEA4]
MRRRGLSLLPDDPDIGWAPYIWLVYIVIVFLVPGLWDPTDDGVVWFASIAATLLFLPLYFAAYWLRGWAKFGCSLAIGGVGLALAPLNTGASVFVVFAAYFAGMAADRIGPAFARIALLGGVVGVGALAVQPSSSFWLPASIGGLVIGLFGVQQVQRARTHATLRLARDEIDALARIAERERIARDLHDLLGHSLSVVALKAELVERLLERDPARAAREIADVRAVAREALAEVRTAVRGYRVGSGAGLEQELAGARRALAAAEVELRCDVGPERVGPHVGAAQEGVLALALREATTNVIRHARAKTCDVAFFADDEEHGLEIRDDGRGPAARPGHGLDGMRKRVESLGGRVAVSGPPGTRIRVSFPAAKEAPP